MAHTHEKRSALRLGLAFAAAVVVPGVVLSIIAIRAATHEQAYLEKQIETALRAEVDQTASVLSAVLERTRAELDSTFAGVPDDAAQTVSWASSQYGPLVGVTYVFSRRGSFLWPSSGPDALASQRDFIAFNSDFFLDRKSVEVYRDALKDKEKGYLKSIGKNSEPGGLAGTQAYQQAVTDLEQDPQLQKDLLSKLSSEGTKLSDRKVKQGAYKSKALPLEQKSMYVTESMRFSQIISDKQSGLIPRSVDDRMMLVYWRKDSGERVVGCSVNMEELKARLAAALPQVVTTARVLTLLDHNGRPVVAPLQKNVDARDWSRPLVAREAGEVLPRWEIAAYLTDPDLLRSRARMTAIILGLLVLMLCVSITVGGALVLRALNAEVRLAQQKTTFVANVSHELKTPLTSIRLFAEMLRDGRQTDPERQSKYLSIMVSETERLTRLINNVLDFARAARGSRSYARRRVELGAVVGEILESQVVRLEHNGFVVEREIPERAIQVDADAEAIKQALLNVLSNAEKYSPDEKWVRVDVGVEADAAFVSIADHGAGIRQQDAQNVFKEFFRADDSLTSKVRGTGLGLTIARQIMRDHGGDITLRPNQPRGSVFTLSLPLAKDTPV